MKIKIELMGALVDYLPKAKEGEVEIIIKDQSSISDLLSFLKIKRKVVVSVNGDEEKGSDFILNEGDQVLIFTVEILEGFGEFLKD